MVAFTVERAEAISLCERVIKSVEIKSNIPILGHFMMTADLGGGLRVEGSDLQVDMAGNIRAEVDSAGSVCVPASTFLSSLKKASGFEVTFSDDGRQAKVSAGRSRFSIPVMPPQDFPVSRRLSDEPTWRLALPGSLLASIEKRVGYIVDEKDHRHAVTGVNLSISGDTMTWAGGATGGLSVIEVDCPEAPYQNGVMAGEESPVDIIIPMPMIRAFRMFESAEIVQVEMTENFIRCRTGFTVSSSLIVGTFPPIDRLIPEKWTTEAVVDRAALLSALECVSLYSEGRERALEIAIKDDVMTLSGYSPEVGSASAEIACECGGEVRIGFAAGNIKKAVQSFDCETLTIRFGEPMLPVIMVDENDASRTVVIMPYALRSARPMKEAA